MLFATIAKSGSEHRLGDTGTGKITDTGKIHTYIHTDTGKIQAPMPRHYNLPNTVQTDQQVQIKSAAAPAAKAINDEQLFQE